jgi:hypothetical protein
VIFNMSGQAKISANISRMKGGGVYVDTGAIFNMSGGSISSNIANQSTYGQGGGVFVYGATFNKSGGIIYGDNDHDSGNNNVTPESNTALSSGNAVYVNNALTSKRDGTAGTGIDLTTTEATILGGWEDFSSTGINAAISVLSSGTLTLPGGEYDMTVKVTVDKSITITTEPGATVILKRNSGFQNVMIEVMGTGALILKVDSGTLTLDGNGLEGAQHLVKVTGSLTMESGVTLSGNKTGPSFSGSGVYVNYGSFTMSGGTINGNTATSGDGGGVCTFETFNMTGGTISGNTAATKGGGVCVSDGSFTKNGGTIYGDDDDNPANGNPENNTACGAYGSSGNAVYVITITGSKKRDSTAGTSVELNSGYSEGWE